MSASAAAAASAAPSARLKFPIQRFFPREEYEERCDRKVNPKAISELGAMYLTANKQPLRNITFCLGKYGYNYRESSWGLTIVHVAAMVGSHDVLKHLIKKKDDKKIQFDVKDRQGFSPMLYACALEDVTSIRLLQVAQGLEVVLDVYRHFPHWKGVLEPAYPSPTDEVCQTVEEKPVTAQRFKELTGAVFYPGHIATPKQWVSHLAHRLEHDGPEMVRELSPIHAFLKAELDKGEAFPKLLLGQQGEAGQGVFAGEKISPGRIITLYGGEYSNGISNHVFAGIDGATTRDLGPQINDGFPNTCLHAVRYPDGRTVGLVLAYGEIEKGAPILLDYRSSHHTKSMGHEEVALDELERFFREHRFMDVYDVPDRMDSIAAHCEVGFNKHRAQYLCHTPSALAILYLKKIMTEADVQVILELPDSTQLGPQVDKFIQLLKGLESQARRFEEIKEKLIDWVQRYAFQTILVVLRTHWFLDQVKRNDFDAVEDALSTLSDSFEKMSRAATLVNDVFQGRDLPPALREASSEVFQIQMMQMMMPGM